MIFGFVGFFVDCFFSGGEYLVFYLVLFVCFVVALFLFGLGFFLV